MLYLLLSKTIILNFVETVFLSKFKTIISKNKSNVLIMLEILSFIHGVGY